jgi:hypothetical protein
MPLADTGQVVGTTTNVLPPNHPTIADDSSEARCPVTNAKVEHHHNIVNHPHPGTSIPDAVDAQDASACPALKNANKGNSITDATCPVVGPVNAHLPPTHPALTEQDSGAVCPVTNATLEHHAGKIAEHKPVSKDAPAAKCPVAGATSS